MKIKILKEDLVKNIQNIQNVVTTKSSLPVLSNVLIEAGQQEVCLTGTDLDIGISSKFVCEIEEKGAIAVPAKRFSDIVRELPEEDIFISTMKNNSMTIKCGKCFFKILGLPKEDFPKLPEFDNSPHVTIDQGVLKKMLSMTCFSMSHDEARYVLNGSLFIFKNKELTIVTTDGKRLSFIKRDTQESAPEKTIIVPSKTIYELNRVLNDQGNTKITFGENQVRFDVENVTTISRLIEGEFPDYKQVIPEEHKDKVSINREQFLLGVKRAALFTTQDSRSIKINILKNKIIVSKSNPMVGETKEEIEADYKGPEITMGFNPSYLTDILKVIPKDELEIELWGPDKPAVMRIEDWYVYLVLPMQLA